MPVTFTAPVVQPSMAKAVLTHLDLDVEGQTGIAVYQPLDTNGSPINGGQPQRVPLTFAQLGLTKAVVYNAVLNAVGLTGVVT